VQSNKQLYGNSNLAPRLPPNFSQQDHTNRNKNSNRNVNRNDPNPSNNKNANPPVKPRNSIVNRNEVMAYSPLATPTNFRNNSFNRGDPYGHNPAMPKIASPYMPGREPVAYPNLESWGVTNDYMNRVGSPYLPVYNSLTRAKLGQPRVSLKIYHIN
jgi:hypothetical protein